MRKDIRRLLPEPVTGYQLDEFERDGYFSFVVPVGTTNLITNPSFETGTTGYSAVGGASILRTAQKSRHGVFSLRVSTNGYATGVSYPVSLSAGKHSLSVDVVGSHGYEVGLRVYSGGNTISRRTFNIYNRWQRISISVPVPVGGTYTIELFNASQSNHVFFTDAWQIEALPYPTTYCDGDRLGYVRGESAYYWTGTKHASTSVRISTTKSGGREVFLRDVGFRVKSFAGLGTPQINNVATPLSGGGSYYQKTTYLEREFSIIGTIFGHSTSDLMNQRKRLIDAIGIGKTPPNQPTLMKYHQYISGGGEIVYDIPCFYQSGLEMGIDNNYSETISLTLRQFDPVIEEQGNTSDDFSVDYYAPISGGFLLRDRNGQWETIEADISVIKIISDNNGGIYVLFDGNGGAYVNGVYCYNVFRYSNGVVDSLYNGVTETPYDICTDNNGNLLVCVEGTSQSAEDSVLLYGLARYNPELPRGWGGGGIGNWESLFPSISNDSVIRAIDVDRDGNVYIAGNFSALGGQTATNVCIYDLLTVTDIGGALVPNDGNTDGLIYNIKYSDRDGVVIGGDFLSIDGVAEASNLAHYSNGAWTMLGAVVSGVVESMCYGKNGDLVIGGSITDIGTLPVYGVARWNGTAWRAFGYFFSDSVQNILGVSRYGYEYLVCGDMSYAYSQSGANVIPHGCVIVGNNIITPVGIMQNKAIRTAYYDEATGNLFTGNRSTLFNSTVGTITAVINIGNSVVYPKVILVGGGQLKSLENHTTNKRVIFNNLPVSYNGTTTVEFKMGGIRIYNEKGEDLKRYLEAGTNDFFLAGGTNYISATYTKNITDFKTTALTTGIPLCYLDGVDESNSDSYILYVSYDYSTSGGDKIYTLEFYSDLAMTSLVASGTFTRSGATPEDGWPPMAIEITEEGSSGITGWVYGDLGDVDITTRWCVGRMFINYASAYISADGGA